MLKLIFFRLLYHPSRDHEFTRSRKYEGKMTCTICRLRV